MPLCVGTFVSQEHFFFMGAFHQLEKQWQWNSQERGKNLQVALKSDSPPPPSFLFPSMSTALSQLGNPLQALPLEVE